MIYLCRILILIPNRMRIPIRKDDISYFGVFDGHGGHKGAFFATKKTGHNIVDDLLQVVRN